MAYENGSISINTENLMPIIKKWMYSEKDIFIREIVSNANDAISKHKKLVYIGEAKLDEGETYKIKVTVNKDDKTIKVEDNGIGMTGEEVKKYINQVAFSGAVDFLEKYQGKAEEKDQIIGHFGMGFYSSFMVSDKVCIDTLSYQADAEGVKWSSEGGTEFVMEDAQRTARGTTVTMYLAEDSIEFLEYAKVLETLKKYCAFLPYEVYLEDLSADSLKLVDDKSSEGNGTEEGLELAKEEPINDTHPLWLKNPKDCTDQEYKDFYQKVFMDYNEPLFWIHLNMDYPFNLKGILYFPKLRHEFERMEGQIKLYYNQVFVADNIKEVIPEFLMLLKGVMDCPDLPLNVSRSFLQNDGYVSKISSHITKKVADKLTALYENERESYEKYWTDINPFVKYGCLREEKFYDRVKEILIYKTTDGGFTSLKNYLARNKAKHENKVFYVTDEKQQAQYIKLFKDHGMEALIFNSMIDNHFIQFLEMKDSAVSFSRIDADLSDSLKEDAGKETDKATQDSLEKLFRDALGKEDLKVKVEKLKAASVPGMVISSEYSRRMQEMSRMYGQDMGGMFKDEQTLVLNSGNKLILSMLKLKDEAGQEEFVKLMCNHIYDLAMMSHKQLEPEAMTAFIDRSNLILEKLTEK